MIQNLQELRQGGIAVTIAKYETPLHNNINKVRLEENYKLIVLFQYSLCT